MNVLLKDEKMDCVGSVWSLICIFGDDAHSYRKELLRYLCYSHTFLFELKLFFRNDIVYILPSKH